MQKEELNQLLYKYHLKPEKKLGQHYLIDESVLEAIIEVADIQKDEKVLEIGAGPGILTTALAKAGADVLAIEFDRNFCRLLQEEYHNWRNVHVLCQDALRLDLKSAELPSKIVANIPYQITNPLVRKILEPGSIIETAILLVQKEVAQRLMAPPGSSERGILTIMVEMYGAIEEIVKVPPEAFWPSPKVDSSVIKITKKSSPEAKDLNQQAFFWLVKQGFSGKRKTLVNSLSGSLRLPKSTATAIVEETGIDPLARAEDLTLQQWIKLFTLYEKNYEKES